MKIVHERKVQMTEDEAPKRANSSEIKPTVDAEEQVRTSPSAELPLCVPLDPLQAWEAES